MQIDGGTIFWAKYPEVPTFSHNLGVEDIIKIRQSNEPAGALVNGGF